MVGTHRAPPAPSNHRPRRAARATVAVMAKLTGTIRRSDLEGGLWILEAEDGERYQLQGQTGSLKDGCKAEITGTVERSAFGIGMSGPIVTVSKVDLT
jgi:hypothetical protein